MDIDTLDQKIALLQRYKELYQLQLEVRALREKVSVPYTHHIKLVLPRFSFAGTYLALYDPKTNEAVIEHRITE